MTRRTNIGLITSLSAPAPFGKASIAASVPEEDVMLADELTRRGMDVRQVAWEDANVDWSSFEMCVLRSVRNFSDDPDVFVRWLTATAQHTQVWNPPSLIEWNLHKRYLDQLADAGVPIVPTAWLGGNTGHTNVGAVMDERGWDTVILKPEVGNAGRGIVLLKRSEAAKGDRLLATAANSAFMVQPYLSKIEVEGELSLIFIDGRYAYAIKKVPAPGDYSIHSWKIENKRLTYSINAVATSADATVIAQAEHALRVMGLDWMALRVDFLPADSGLLLSEIEVIAPTLYFPQASVGVQLLADAITRRIRSAS